MLVILRDGRKLHGVLRSYDQFANLVLEDTYERIYHQNVFAEQHHGLFLIRGENVVLMGEIDLDKEDEELEVKKQHEEAKAQYLYENKGFSREGGEGDGY
ncbi:hypothetical protein BKA70DRAFT_1418098 [Coprinopsis sp. MPI-PUGE-AT-0042]|nr:hypothetical protein BKA70DRAFT_1418098 [Coprinopsis sp. MPI-PUGE-AT-0042]